MPVLRLSALPTPSPALIGQILRFGVVGGCGYLVDTAVVYAVRGWLGLYVGGMLSFLVAATCTWALNRVWTFRGRGDGTRPHRQWAAFLLANIPGLVLNRGTYMALVAFSAFCATNPLFATAGGAVAGMGVNFLASRHLVFR